MSTPANSYDLSLAEQLRAAPDREALIANLSDAEALALLFDWETWARANQLLPTGQWRTWLVMAGRGYGKTRVGAETVRHWIKSFEHVNIIVPTSGDIEKVLIEGDSGLLKICSPQERPRWIGNKSLFRWPNGATSFVFSAEEPDRLRGPQAEKLWTDELAAWRYAEETWDMAMMGLRLGDSPQVVATTTPKPTKLIRELAKRSTTHLTRGTTYENRENLAEAFFADIITKYEGTRLGRQELNAELLEDNPGALWNQAQIDLDRVSKLPDLQRIVIAVDPAVTAKEQSDEWGIIAVGRDKQRPPHFYVFDDVSAVLSPNSAAKIIVRAYRQHRADRVVAETNNGGDLVEAIIRNADENISYTGVHASRGKIIRAEPAAALYEQHRVHHVGFFPVLESQMCDFNPATDDYSPDRMDALVWGLAELAESTSGVLNYYAARADQRKQQQNEEKKVPVTAKKWSETIRAIAMGITPEITKEQWPAIANELTEWIAFVEKEPERMKEATAILKRLEKKFGKIAGVTCDAEAEK